MKSTPRHCHSLFILFFLPALLLGVALPPFSDALENPPESLNFAGKIVKVRAWVENAPQAAVTEQVNLIVEVATPTWFTRGTQIKNIEISDTIIFQANAFATNFTRQESGKTWSVQQWTVIIHPMKEKTYAIPGIPVTFFTVDEKGNPIAGERFTAPLQFQAIVPGELAGIAHWVATPQMTVRQSMEGPLNDCNVGDAVKRRVEIEGHDLPAMMLRVFPETAPQGLAIYHDPPKLIDDVNRGIRIGKRLESSTIVIEKPGSYRIPGRVYTWWNVHDRRTETIKTPDLVISTSGFEKLPDDPAGIKKEKSPWTGHFGFWTTVFISGSGAFFVIALILLKRRRSDFSAHKSVTEKQLRRQLQTALKNQDPVTFLQTLYKWFDLFGQGAKGIPLRAFLMERQSTRPLMAFNCLMAHLYGNPDQPPLSYLKDPMKELIRITKRGFMLTFGWPPSDRRHAAKCKPLPPDRSGRRR